MVKLSRLLLAAIQVNKPNFFDTMRIYVRGGGGGQGLPKYGGHGGQGGAVIIQGSSNSSLQKVYSDNPSKRYIAQTGDNSRSHNLLGQPGDDMLVKVPLGVCIKTDEGRQIGEINKEGDTVTVAQGGRGGGPWNDFRGERAPSRCVKLDLKLIADVGLVGFPNAGKSSLLKAISRARPKVADYAFTTIRPNIGVVKYDDLRQISLADLPGLIEGAHINVGMGHSFLKHVERTKLLLFVVDVYGFKLGIDHKHRTAFETVLLLNKELELYKPELLNKPALLALNKIDLKDSEDMVHTITQQLSNIEDEANKVDPALRPQKFVTFSDIVSISALQLQNIDLLKNRIRDILDYNAHLAFNEVPQKQLGTRKDVMVMEDRCRDMRKQLEEHHSSGLV